MALVGTSLAQLADIVLDSEATTGIAPHTITINGAWNTGTGQLDKHGVSFHADGNVHGAGKWIRYQPSIPSTGWYRVYLWAPSNPAYANNAQIDVQTADGLKRPTVNMRQNGGKWRLIGTFRFDAGISGYVTIKSTRSDEATNPTNGYVAADAVRFQQIEPELILDNGDVGVTQSPAGSWISDAATSEGAAAVAAVNGNYLHDGSTGQNGNETRSIEYRPTFPVSGRYQVYLTWPASSTNSPNTHVDVYSATGAQPIPISVDQRTSGYEGVYIGTFDFAAGSNNSGRVVISNRYDAGDGETGGRVVADSVRFVRVPGSTPRSEIVVDQRAPGTVRTDTWTAVAAALPTRFGLDHETDGNPGTKGTKSFSFTPDLPQAGYYSVYAWWPADANNSSIVPIDVTTASGVVSAGPINQRLNGGQWNFIGKWWFNSGTAGGVKIKNNGANGEVIADAVVFVRGEDGDEDGMADSWELAHGFNPSDPSDATMDYDGDGLTNLEECRASLDPKVAQTLSKTSGDGQKGPANATLPSLLQVKVSSGSGSVSEPGAPVTFTVEEGGGLISVDGSQWNTSVTCTTNQAGAAQVYWKLGKYGSTDNKVTARFGQTQSVQFAARSNDLVLRWTLDEGGGTVAYDASGTGSDGSIWSPTWGQSYDGTSDLHFSGRHTGDLARSHIGYSNFQNEVLPETGGKFSISFWFKTQPMVPGRTYWLAGSENYLQTGFRIGIDTGLYGTTSAPALQFWTTESGGTIHMRVPEEIKAGRWYHFSVTHDGTKTTLYLNRKQVAQSSDTLLQGTNALYVGALPAGHYELAGEIEDFRIYSAVVPPHNESGVMVAPQTIDVMEGGRSIVNLGPANLTSEYYRITQLPSCGRLLGLERDANGDLVVDGGSNGHRVLSGNMVIYRPNSNASAQDTFKYVLVNGTSVSDEITVHCSVATIDDPVTPKYNDTLIVDRNSSKTRQLICNNPDNHAVGFDVISVTKDGVPVDSSEWSISNGVFTYNASSEVGECVLTYTVQDYTNGGAPSAPQKMYIHVVAPIYLSAHAGGTDTDPYFEQRGITPVYTPTAEAYTDLIKASSTYSAFYYAPGVFETKGSFAGVYDTAKEGCKHVALCPGDATIKLVGAYHITNDGVIFAAQYDRITNGFEVHGLILDCNPLGNPKYSSTPRTGTLGAISTFGSNIIIRDCVVKGFGTFGAGQECFPVFLYQGAARGDKGPFENITVENCTITSPAENNVDGLSCITILGNYLDGTRNSAESLINGVVRNCRIIDVASDFAYAHAAGAPLIQECVISGERIEAAYMESGIIDAGWMQDSRSAVFRDNILIGTSFGLRVDARPTAEIGEVVLQDNEFIVTSAGSGEFGILAATAHYKGGYLDRLRIEGNVMSRRVGLARPDDNFGFRGMSLGELGAAVPDPGDDFRIKGLECFENIIAAVRPEWASMILTDSDISGVIRLEDVFSEDGSLVPVQTFEGQAHPTIQQPIP